ncbi:diguanylate cyclase (GGDEF) domain-containing protein [Burkholderiales bacterium JOSHI_001]|nr:diguanylate cyclase (GGDEF) domain-containing protein [Burkholderiales bacterium JOSHI_001]
MTSPVSCAALDSHRRWFTWACLLLMMMMGLPLPARAVAADRLQLSDARSDIDAWAHVQVLSDPESQWQVGDVLTRLKDFQPPGGRHANLGVRRDVVWMRVPLDVPMHESGQWLLDLNYPSLDDVTVYLVTDGRSVRELHLGRQVPFGERPMPSRSHVAPLRLEPGQEHELVLRVKTASSMIVPIRFMKPDAFNAREATVQLLQGVAAGIGLCLLVYSLAHWLSLRDATFVQYALSASCITLFFFSYHGLGSQHLWSGSSWLNVNMAPFSVLLALVGGLLFLDQALGVRDLSPLLSRLLRGAALAAGLVATAFALGLIGYRQAHLAGTILGPMPVLLGLPAAVARLRRGDRVALYIVLGWGLYAVGIATMALLLRGLVDFNDFTNHAFQAGALLEMVMWLRALGARMDETRRLAESVGREREALRSLAHTDALTGLPNRRGLALEIQALLPQATAQRLLAVYLLDLDGFKAVNDRLGHDAGDELLKAVAQRLRALLRNRDVVARLGGDEFVVLAGDLPSDADARHLGTKLLEGFKAPFQINGQSCRVGLTIGYALGPLDGHDEGSLLKRADAAMYAGKQAGKHCMKRGAASVGLVGA